MRGIEQIPWLYDAMMTVMEPFGLGRRPGVGLVIASAEALPLRNGSFDTVVSSLVFCSVPDSHRGLREIARVLCKGGLLRMLEHVRHHHPLVARLQDVGQPFWTWLTGGCHPNRETEKNVEAAGFAIDPRTLRAQGAMRLFSARWQGMNGAKR